MPQCGSSTLHVSCPFIIGMIDGWSNRIAILTVLGLSLVSVSVEYFAIARVYGAVPALASRLTAPPVSGNETEPLTQPSAASASKFSYWRHPLLLVSLSMTLLYVTVLSFSGQMIVFLLAWGMAPDTVTLFRTGSVVVELGATLVAPRVIQRFGPFKAGAAFVDFQFGVLLATTVRFAVLGKSAAAALVLALGTAISRIGLWGFDLSSQIIIQDGVKESERGKFSTTEKSLQNWAMIVMYITTMIFSEPDQFKWPMAVSVGAVGAAAGLFNVAWWQSRRPAPLLTP